MARKSIVAGNWKMNTTPSQGLDLYKELESHVLSQDVDVIVAAPYLHLPMMAVSNGKVTVAAQNCSQHVQGAYTGEVSVDMLLDVGVNTVLIGHSERRELYKECNTMLKEKVSIAIAKGMQVIFCCGEPLEVRKEGTQDDYVATQLKESLFHLTAQEMSNVVIAYEPIWAIGTGETASPAQAQDMHRFIRETIATTYSEAVADKMRMLYGGSVKPDNAQELFSKPDVDGGLVGGASLTVDSFLQIISAAV